MANCVCPSILKRPTGSPAGNSGCRVERARRSGPGSDMRILVTGASGNLGGYLLRHLQSSPHTVVAWGGSRAGDRFGVPVLPVDLTDPDLVRMAFDAARPDAVLHAGALASVAACH